MNRLTIILLFTFIISMCSCNDLIEKDVTNDKVTIISPGDNYTTSTYNVNFIWEGITNVKTFRLQIVSPEFNNIVSLVVDTLINGNKFNYNLMPGKYQWRLRAENSSSFSEYMTRYIKVDTNSDLSGQVFITNEPKDEEYTKNNIIVFAWQIYPYATSYEYILSDVSSSIIKNKESATTSITDTLLEGVYYWKVRAKSAGNNSFTSFSIPKKITIDKTPPSPPLQQAPENNGLLPNAVIFNWINDLNVLGDSLVFSSDSTFFSNNTFLYTTDTFFAAPPLTINTTYYWKIKSMDKAGNSSAYSNVYRFTVTF